MIQGHMMTQGVLNISGQYPSIGWVLFPTLGFLGIPAVISLAYLWIKFGMEDRYLAYHRAHNPPSAGTRPAEKHEGNHAA